MSKRDNDYSGDAVRAAHIDFIRANFNLLAILYYQGWQSKGPGMIVVNEADFLKKPKGVLTEIRMTFMAAAALNQGKAIGDKENAWFGNVRHDQTMLVGFVRTDKGFSSYQLVGVGDNTPKAIFDRSRASDSASAPNTPEPDVTGPCGG